MKQQKRPTLPPSEAYQQPVEEPSIEPPIETPEQPRTASIEPLIAAIRLPVITKIQDISGELGSFLTSSSSKSIVESKTVLSIIFGLIIGASTIFSPAVIDRKPINRGDVYSFVALLLTSVGGIMGRYAAKQPLNTPKGLPGRDPD